MNCHRRLFTLRLTVLGLLSFVALTGGCAASARVAETSAAVLSPRAAALSTSRISTSDLRRSLFGGATWPGRPFSATSFWNRPLGIHAPLASRSRAYVNELVRQVRAYGPWLNNTSYSVPVYVVGPSVRRVKVTLDTWGPDLQAEFDAVPIPASAQSAVGGDAQMTVWQPSTDRMWEFWQMRFVHGRWHARWGGEMGDVSHSSGYFTHYGQTANWGATATGLPLLGGLVTFADLRRGSINHALAISLVETEPDDWSWPAQRTDGYVFQKRSGEIPEGMRFRLDPRIDVSELHLPRIDAMLARAAQRYGIVVRDKAGAVVFYGQDPVAGMPNPWPDAFDDQWPNHVLDAFPWGDLQALRPQMECCWSASHPTELRASSAHHDLGGVHRG